ncbi:MAG: hypothetical protein JSR77_12495 [Planctomycetes bacterium]|nr:hypothetical protein [Planctomycetota bacterium]
MAVVQQAGSGVLEFAPAYRRAVTPAFLWLACIIGATALAMIAVPLQSLRVPWIDGILVPAARFPLWAMSQLPGHASPLLMFAVHAFVVLLTMRRVFNCFGPGTPEASAHDTGFAGAAISLLLVVVAVETVPTLVVPPMEERFADFGVAVPWVTVKLIHVSRWAVGSNPGQVVPGVGLLSAIHLGVTLLLARCVMSSAPITCKKLCTGAIYLGVGILLTIEFVALLIPVVQMIESLKGGGRV